MSSIINGIGGAQTATINSEEQQSPALKQRERAVETDAIESVQVPNLAGGVAETGLSGINEPAQTTSGTTYQGYLILEEGGRFKIVPPGSSQPSEWAGVQTLEAVKAFLDTQAITVSREIPAREAVQGPGTPAYPAFRYAQLPGYDQPVLFGVQGDTLVGLSGTAAAGKTIAMSQVSDKPFGVTPLRPQGFSPEQVAGMDALIKKSGAPIYLSEFGPLPESAPPPAAPPQEATPAVNPPEQSTARRDAVSAVEMYFAGGLSRAQAESKIAQYVASGGELPHGDAQGNIVNAPQQVISQQQLQQSTGFNVGDVVRSFDYNKLPIARQQAGKDTLYRVTSVEIQQGTPVYYLQFVDKYDSQGFHMSKSMLDTEGIRESPVETASPVTVPAPAQAVAPAPTAEVEPDFPGVQNLIGRQVGYNVEAYARKIGSPVTDDMRRNLSGSFTVVGFEGNQILIQGVANGPVAWASVDLFNVLASADPPMLNLPNPQDVVALFPNAMSDGAGGAQMISGSYIMRRREENPVLIETRAGVTYDPVFAQTPVIYMTGVPLFVPESQFEEEGS